MSLRLPAVLVFALVPFAARAADDENPYKNAKVGDYAKYDTTLKAPNLGELQLARVQTVTAANDKELTLKTVTVVNNKELPNKKSEQKLDLTKPFDPAGTGDASAGGESYKWEKVKDGKEKLKVGGKEYDCTWTSYKVVPAKGDAATEGELRVWLSKDIPFVVKRSLVLKTGNNDVLYTATLVEFGNKK